MRSIVDQSFVPRGRDDDNVIMLRLILAAHHLISAAELEGAFNNHGIMSSYCAVPRCVFNC
jgi:hypothetical protein